MIKTNKIIIYSEKTHLIVTFNDGSFNTQYTGSGLIIKFKNSPKAPLHNNNNIIIYRRTILWFGALWHIRPPIFGILFS